MSEVFTDNVVIPANGEIERNYFASYIVNLQSDGDLDISFDDKTPAFFAQGIGYPVDFNKVRIINRTGADITAKLNIGSSRTDDNRLSLSGAFQIATPANLETKIDDSIAAGATELVAAANASRNEILITNLSSNSAPVRVGDSNTGANRGVEVGVGQTITLNTSAAVYVHNTHTGAQSVAILEVL